MKTIIDNFSTDSGNYAKYRPTYPKEFIEEISHHVNYKKSALDIGTGNGQVAVVLSEIFAQVNAIDISENQLKNAIQLPNIEYQVSRAEETPFYNQYFDLITVGQAFHWFDFDAFYEEAKRILKPGGVLALFGYGVLRGSADFNAKMNVFYEEVIGSYWDKERIYIDEKYQNINFPFNEINLSKDYFIKVNWTLAQLKGYLESWSAVKKYEKQNNENPVEDFIQLLSGIEKISLEFPVFYRIGSLK
ncbi:methylase involved in ubiquinone/menaquinone biosynthesis [Galbibacter orientalis DSM 19592]|uniref:Methylase involved in ubiquinone/menaquinone biosynthesis n=1 Tax=Galbibacter orientalis DSM 19592 TaxID=926559 RepID=I3C743_9FLAO|nr:class I SAM-dependent methyltransferase [Galbibacter orientalis]EIJ39436.1 methylase involved in ubiquinone/menaquinone biosynthesis [Galbibacter orientalis DSM 19592]